jgi:plasmid maintenance system antidote protein VapI
MISRAAAMALCDPTAHPLKRSRLLAGYTVRGLAERAGCHYNTVHYAEVGKRKLSDETATRLAVVLGCAPEDLRP